MQPVSVCEALPEDVAEDWSEVDDVLPDGVL
jgi:hypothetical protein